MERPDAGQRRLLAFAPGRPGRCRTNLVLQRIMDELRDFHAALARHSPRSLKQFALDLDAGFFGGRHAVMVAAPAHLPDPSEGLPAGRMRGRPSEEGEPLPRAAPFVGRSP